MFFGDIGLTRHILPGGAFFLCLLDTKEERRKESIDMARGQLVGLREGLQGLEKVAREDGRPALEEAVKATIKKVCVCVFPLAFYNLYF